MELGVKSGDSCVDAGQFDHAFCAAGADSAISQAVYASNARPRSCNSISRVSCGWPAYVERTALRAARRWSDKAQPQFGRQQRALRVDEQTIEIEDGRANGTLRQSHGDGVT